jgi:protein TonB
MKRLTIWLSIISITSFAQTNENKGTIKVKKVESEKTEDPVAIIEPIIEAPLTIAEQMPSFPGGDTERQNFINKNIQYPLTEQQKGISGTCYVTFIVEADGTISNVRILRGVLNGPGCDMEAVRVVKLMPKWIPGKQNGRVVDVQFNLPIRFKLK